MPPSRQTAAEHAPPEVSNAKILTSEVPLSEMFGYSTELRSATQGKAEYTMEFAKYSPVPMNVQQDLIKDYEDAKK